MPYRSIVFKALPLYPLHDPLHHDKVQDHRDRRDDDLRDDRREIQDDRYRDSPRYHCIHRRQQLRHQQDEYALIG